MYVKTSSSPPQIYLKVQWQGPTKLHLPGCQQLGLHIQQIGCGQNFTHGCQRGKFKLLQLATKIKILRHLFLLKRKLLSLYRHLLVNLSCDWSSTFRGAVCYYYSVAIIFCSWRTESKFIFHYLVQQVVGCQLHHFLPLVHKTAFLIRK